MTLSASDIRNKKRFSGRMAIIYICIALFCGLFSAIYEHFSHAVYSDFMTYLFMFPLVGGAVPFTLIGLIRPLQCPSPSSSRLYNSGIAALTLGSCLSGVLEIYGTTSIYVNVYWIAGVALAGIGITLYLYKLLFKPNKA